MMYICCQHRKCVDVEDDISTAPYEPRFHLFRGSKFEIYPTIQYMERNGFDVRAADLSCGGKEGVWRAKDGLSRVDISKLIFAFLLNNKFILIFMG